MKPEHATALVTGLFVILLALAVYDIMNIKELQELNEKYYVECPCKKGTVYDPNATWGGVEVCNGTITGVRIPIDGFYGR
jgi:hypothetical protein